MELSVHASRFIQFSSPDPSTDHWPCGEELTHAAVVSTAKKAQKQSFPAGGSALKHLKQHFSKSLSHLEKRA